MINKIKKLSPEKGSWPTVIFLIFLQSFAFCSHDRENEEALELEKSGRKAEALYLYSQILEKDPDNFTANKRTGFLLSENMASLTSAIYYLNQALNSNKTDNDILIKLFDLYLRVKDYNKAEEILSMIQSFAGYPVLQAAFTCVFGQPTDVNKARAALQKIDIPDNRLTDIIRFCNLNTQK